MRHKNKYIIGCDPASGKDITVISWIRDDGYIESLTKPPDMDYIQSVIAAAFKIPKKYFGREKEGE